MARDEFSKAVRDTVAARAGLRCSNPGCQKLTSGPAIDPARAVSIGVAAHITAASPGGPRFDPTLTAEQRSSLENAIWVCAACGILIDRDAERFPASVLREWREWAEGTAALAITAGTMYRPIAATEVLQELSLEQLVAVRALQDEFGCHVETELHVPAGEGWLRLDAAVVRGEQLVAIDIREHHGKGIAYFQVEYLLELCGKLIFPRFQGCVVYLVVVSDGPVEADADIEARLRQIAEACAVEVHIRMYRLNTLRAKYGL